MSDTIPDPLPPGPPVYAYVRYLLSTFAIVGYSRIPYEEPSETEGLYSVLDQDEAEKLLEPGEKTINIDTGVITVTPPPPPPVRYVNTTVIDQEVRTTTNVLTEVFRFPTEEKHVYRATIQLVAIDAGNGNTKDAEARMTFKRGTGPSPVQIGSTAILYASQDSAAAVWAIQPSVQGADLVISVAGASGRTVDWHLLAEFHAYAPEGLPG